MGLTEYERRAMDDDLGHYMRQVSRLRAENDALWAELHELQIEIRLGWSEDDILPGPAHERAYRGEPPHAG